MELSRHSPAPARFTGIGIVIAVHVAAITALSLGFINQPTIPKVPNIPVLPKDIQPLEPPEPPKYQPQTPSLPQVPQPEIMLPPDILVETPPITVIEATRTDGAPSATGGSTGSTGTPPTTLVQEQPRIQTPGAICSVMPRPELPVLSWSGEAVLHALATVRDGRVVASEIRVAQGAVDAKSRRALQRAVETALAGYQCAGNATFQQDFAFRLD